MSLKLWESVRILGWLIIIIYFLVEFLRVKEDLQIFPEKSEAKIRYLVGIIGTALVLLGYIMLNI